MNGRIWVKAASSTTTGMGEDGQVEELEKMCFVIKELKG